MNIPIANGTRMYNTPINCHENTFEKSANRLKRVVTGYTEQHSKAMNIESIPLSDRNLHSIVAKQVVWTEQKQVLSKCAN